MKSSKRSACSRRIVATKRAQLLAAFERSGLSAAAFAREHGLRYSTFCGWRRRRAKFKPAPAFVQVELTTSAPAAAGLIVELAGGARLRIDSPSQLALAAQLIHHLHADARPC